MDTLRFFLAVLLTCVATTFGLAAADYTPLSDTQLQQYYDQLHEQVERSETHLQELIDEMADPTMMSPSLRIELQFAIDQNEAKKTLVNNFVGTPSMRSPAVRKRLLDLLASKEITESDLLGLQALVDTERRNIKAFDENRPKPTLKDKSMSPSKLKPRSIKR
jgi:hypothetical protein